MGEEFQSAGVNYVYWDNNAAVK